MIGRPNVITWVLKNRRKANKDAMEVEAEEIQIVKGINLPRLALEIGGMGPQIKNVGACRS